MRLAVDRAMGEGSLYAPEHAALALLQVEGDSFEAAFHLRAYRATLERRYFSEDAEYARDVRASPHLVDLSRDSRRADPRSDTGLLLPAAESRAC